MVKLDPPKGRLSDYEVDERAAEARVILESPILKEALEDIYSRAAGTLVTSDIGSLTATQAHAIMKAIVEIRTQLEQFITEKKMREKYTRGGSHGE